MDLLFSSSMRKTAVPTLTLHVGSLPFSRSFESTVYVMKEIKNINSNQIRQSHNVGNNKMLPSWLASFKVDKLVPLAK